MCNHLWRWSQETKKWYCMYCRERHENLTKDMQGEIDSTHKSTRQYVKRLAKKRDNNG